MISQDKNEVLIIGGGVIGISCAYYLAQKGLSVSVVESGEICSGCSYGNAGLIVPSLSIPLAAPGVITKALKWMLDPRSPFFIKLRPDLALFSWLYHFILSSQQSRLRPSIGMLRDLTLASLPLFDSLTSSLNMNCGYERKGILSLYRSPETFQSAQRDAQLLKEFGLHSEVLDTAGTLALEPSVSPTILGGIYYPGDCHITPDAFVQSLAKQVANMGVKIYANTKVSGFTVNNRKILTVKTNRNDFSPDLIVLAAGSWSSELAHLLRISLPLQPGKGYSVTATKIDPAPRIPLLFGEAKVAVTPMGDKVRVAGTLELSGFDASLNQRRIKSITDSVPDYLVTNTRFDTGEMWSGFRPCTPDGLPTIGRCRDYDNLIIATGHAMLGVTLGPITGKLVAQLACDEKPSFPLDLLRVERFS